MRAALLLTIWGITACQDDVLPDIHGVQTSDSVTWLEQAVIPTLEVRSASGIGQANLAGAIPLEFRVHVQLKGLERFRLQIGDQHYDLEVNQEGALLTPPEPSPLRILSSIEKADGYVVSINLRDTKGINEHITLSWVDFFR